MKYLRHPHAAAILIPAILVLMARILFRFHLSHRVEWRRSSVLGLVARSSTLLLHQGSWSDPDHRFFHQLSR